MRLEQVAVNFEHVVDYYFNSIKVRLELISKTFPIASFIFQFHKGAIRTFLLGAFVIACDHFNSIKVRLEL